ncbi:MAG: hypothetical protein HS113_25725 [Verrucomicrobiales bacterium]|nr:hypothetical protein [Verrucomicrobiales bacterium]
MKSLRNLILIGQLLPLLLVHTPSAAAEVTVPFTGAFEGSETGITEFPTRYIFGDVGGTASHLGRFTLHYEFVVDLLTISGSGTAALVAANGDRLYAEVTGQATVVEPGYLSIVEIYTLTDGDGRFTGASGGFTLTRALEQSTGITSGSFEGTLVLPKGK